MQPCSVTKGVGRFAGLSAQSFARRLSQKRPRDLRDAPTRSDCVPTCLKALVTCMSWRHNGVMPSVQIKDVPEQTHAVLRQRAAAAHQSLQEYLLAHLIAEASQPSLEEILDRAGGRSGGSLPLADAVKAVRGDRARR